MTNTSASFPVPYAAAERQSWRALAAGLRNNALAGFPPRAFEEMAVARSFVGHQQIILNDPDGIRHVLIENADNYRRTASIPRLLGPVVGNGLFLADGDDWRPQRRTAAPAFAPRMMGAVAGHVGRACDRLVAELMTATDGEVDLFARLQLLALASAAAPRRRGGAARPRSGGSGRVTTASCRDPRRGGRGAAALSAGVFGGATGQVGRPRGRYRDPGARGGVDRAVGIASPPSAVARS